MKDMYPIVWRKAGTNMHSSYQIFRMPTNAKKSQPHQFFKPYVRSCMPSFFAGSRLLVVCSLVVYLTWWGLLYEPCCHSPLPVAFLSLRLRLCLSAWGRFEDSTACTHSGRCGALFGFADIRVVGSRNLAGGAARIIAAWIYSGGQIVIESGWEVYFFLHMVFGWEARGRKRKRDNYCVS